MSIWPDLEGIGGVEDVTQVFPASPQYQIFITEETNAAIRGFKKGGIGEIYVIDGHGYDMSPNIRADLLDKRAILITKEEMLSQEWKAFQIEIGSKVNASALLGCHARRQAKGFMSHTRMHYPPIRVWINDIEISETHLYVFWAGHHNFSNILFTGDDIAMEEAAVLVPDAERVVTKRSLSRNKCKLIPFDTVKENVEYAALRAANRLAKIKPHKLPDEFRIEVSFNSQEHVFACQNIPNAEIRNNSVVMYVADNYYEATSFIDTTIDIARYYESHKLVSVLMKKPNISEEIAKWERERCVEMGANWDSE